MADKTISVERLLRLNASQESARSADTSWLQHQKNEENYLQYENYIFRGSSTIGWLIILWFERFERNEKNREIH